MTLSVSLKKIYSIPMKAFGLKQNKIVNSENLLVSGEV